MSSMKDVPMVKSGAAPIPTSILPMIKRLYAMSLAGLQEDEKEPELSHDSSRSLAFDPSSYLPKMN